MISFIIALSKKLFQRMGILIVLFLNLIQADEWAWFMCNESSYDILSDSDYVWLGTNMGLLRLDKKSGQKEYFTYLNTPLPGHRTWALERDLDNILWLGGTHGAGYFDGVEWKVFTKHNSGIGINNVCCISVDENNAVWFGAADRAFVVHYNQTSWKIYKPKYGFTSGYISSIVHNWHGKTVVGATAGSGAGFYIVGDTSLVLDTIVRRTDVNALALDHQGELWIGSHGRGLIWYDGKDTVVYNTKNSMIPSDCIYDIKTDSRGMLYLATNNGLAVFFQDKWQVYTTENSDIPSDFVFKIDIDERNVLWVATEEEGFASFDGNTWKTYTIGNTPLTAYGYFSIGIDKKGRSWLGQKENIVMFDRYHWSAYDTTQWGQLSNYFPLVLNTSHKKLWSDQHCAVLYDTLGWWDSYTIGAPGHGSAIKYDQRGIYWHATKDGLWQYTDTGATIYTNQNSNLPNNHLHTCAIDPSGTLWLCDMPSTGSGGLLMTFDGKEFEVQQTLQPSYWISDLAFEPTGVLWYSVMTRSGVGPQTGGGIYRKEGDQIANFTVSNSGLSSNSVSELCLDSLGILWIGTYSRGLVRFDRNNSWQTFHTGNAKIPANDIISLQIDGYGNKWVGLHIDGIALYKKGGVDIPTSIENKADIAPDYKNKCCHSVSMHRGVLRFSLDQETDIALQLHSINGRKIQQWDKKRYKPGKHTIRLFNMHRSMGYGVYLLSIKSNTSIERVVINWYR